MPAPPLPRRFSLRSVRAGLLLTILGPLAGCTAVDVLNNLSALPPTRAPVTRQADLAYGPHPRQRVDVYRPARLSPDARARPAVVFFYGGGWRGGNKRDYRFVGRSLAAAGYAAAVADYRVYPDVVFPDFVRDAAAAVAYVERHADALGIDSHRIHLLGHSSGAHLAAMLAVNPGYLADAGASPGVIRSAALLAGPYDFVPLQDEQYRVAFGENPDDPAVQPITFVRPTSSPVASPPPLLLVVGTADAVVDPRNTFSFARALREAGRETQTVIYPGRGHVVPVLALARGFTRLEPTRRQVLEFFGRAASD